MIATRLFPWFRQRVSHGNAAARFLSADNFRSVLERERSRADRSGKPLALLAFTLLSKEAARMDLARLGDILDVRLRSTDVKGFLNNHRIGVLLTDTNKEGATKLGADLQEQYREHEVTVEYEAFVYPEEGDGEDGETSLLGEDDEESDQRGVVENAQPLEVMFVRRMPLWKRALDVAGASVGLFISAPFILAAAILIKLTSPGPVFFSQKRSGLGGKPFYCHKLRTMYVDAEARKAELRKHSEQDGPAFKIKNDPRITTVGKYLRKTCLDELPQLWNVLKGEMSLVGPRPLPCDEQAGCQRWQRRRLDVTPGVTCIWQVDGGRHVPFADWMRMDMQYMRRGGLWSDIKLIAKTALRVVRHKGT